MCVRTRWLPTSVMWAYRSRLSAKYWKRLPLATPARRAMTLRLPPEKPWAANSVSAAATTAARRSPPRRDQVTVGIAPPRLDMTTGHITVAHATVKRRSLQRGQLLQHRRHQFAHRRMDVHG